MSEQAPNQELTLSPERFSGVPTDVSFKGIEYTIPDADKETWNPGVVDSNGGLVGAHDMDRPVIHIAPQEDAEIFSGYEAGHANVPLTGGDQDGWPGGRLAREVVAMGINRFAREAGVRGRTIPTPDGNYEMFTADPFDKGDFLDMTGVSETSPQGEEINHRDLVTELASTTSGVGREALATIGKFNSNNGVLSWVTPEGKTQIAPMSDERLARLEELGYETGDINVPHSNGEVFSESQYGNPGQTFGEMQLDDMAAAGKTMTLEERNSGSFRNVLIIGDHLKLIKQ